MNDEPFLTFKKLYVTRFIQVINHITKLVLIAT